MWPDLQGKLLFQKTRKILRFTPSVIHLIMHRVQALYLIVGQKGQLAPNSPSLFLCLRAPRKENMWTGKGNKHMRWE